MFVSKPQLDPSRIGDDVGVAFAQPLHDRQRFTCVLVDKHGGDAFDKFLRIPGQRLGLSLVHRRLIPIGRRVDRTEAGERERRRIAGLAAGHQHGELMQHPSQVAGTQSWLGRHRAWQVACRQDVNQKEEAAEFRDVAFLRCEAPVARIGSGRIGHLGAVIRGRVQP